MDSTFDLSLAPPPPAPPLCQAVFMSSATVNLLPGCASLSTVVLIVGGKLGLSPIVRATYAEWRTPLEGEAVTVFWMVGGARWRLSPPTLVAAGVLETFAL